MGLYPWLVLGASMLCLMLPAHPVFPCLGSLGSRLSYIVYHYFVDPWAFRHAVSFLEGRSPTAWPWWP